MGAKSQCENVTNSFVKQIIKQMKNRIGKAIFAAVLLVSTMITASAQYTSCYEFGPIDQGSFTVQVNKLVEKQSGSCSGGGGLPIQVTSGAVNKSVTKHSVTAMTCSP